MIERDPYQEAVKRYEQRMDDDETRSIGSAPVRHTVEIVDEDMWEQVLNDESIVLGIN